MAVTALSMVVPDAHRAKLQLVRDYQGAMRALGYQDFTQGSLEAYVNTRVLAEVPVTVLEPVAQAGMFGRAWDQLRLWLR